MKKCDHMKRYNRLHGGPKCTKNGGHPQIRLKNVSFAANHSLQKELSSSISAQLFSTFRKIGQAWGIKGLKNRIVKSSPNCLIFCTWGFSNMENTNSTEFLNFEFRKGSNRKFFYVHKSSNLLLLLEIY